MAGTNGVKIKRRLHTRLSAAAELTGVQVDLSLNARATHREYVYFGDVNFDQQYVTSRGGGDRFPRHELAYIALFVEVWTPNPGASAEAEIEDRALEIGEVVENLIASDPNLGDLADVIYGGVSSGAVVVETTDTSVGVTVAYRLTFESRIR